MSTQPRRSLRLRIPNLPTQSNDLETEKKKKMGQSSKSTVPTGRKKNLVNKEKEEESEDEVKRKKSRTEIGKMIANLMKRSPDKRMEREDNNDKDEDKSDSDSASSKKEQEEKEDKSGSKSIPSSGESSKSHLPSEVPTRRKKKRVNKVTKKEEEEEESEDELKRKKSRMEIGIKVNGRPQRGCVTKMTVESYNDLMSGSASSSDVTSSESEVDDPYLEMEMKKAKRRAMKGMRKEREESTSDNEEEEEEEGDGVEELDEDEPVKKRTLCRKGERKENGRGGKKIPIQRPKRRQKDLPVKIMYDRDYNVDYAEMVKWESKSVKMMREVREFEKTTSNAGEMMESVNEFIQRCLKEGRMNEMDEKESIRIARIHEEEIEEMDRMKNMNIGQRKKEKVEKEKKRMEDEEKMEEKSDEEEDKWEEMEMAEEGDKSTVQVKIENVKKLKAPWKVKWIRQQVNREVRQRCENVHKVHLISYLSHLRHLMAQANSLTRGEGGVGLAARALSLIPSHLVDTVDKEPKKKKEKRTVERKRTKMEVLIDWWRKEFKKVEKEEAKKWEGVSEEKRWSQMMENGEYETTKDAAVLFLSFSSLLSTPFRLIARCLVVTKKPSENVHVNKRKTNQNKTKGDKDEEEPKNDNTSLEYWCELWNEKRKTWTVFDPSINSHSDSKKKGKKGKKEEENDDGMQTLHNEPFHSMMDKAGPVLYFIAVDQDSGVRDVSLRYLNGKDVISRQWKGRRANEEWMKELWQKKEWRIDAVMSELEDEEWVEELRKVDLRKRINAFKDHPLYVLDRDVLKMQMIFPYDTEPIGEIKDCKIYLRKFLRPLNTAKWYEKMGRVVKTGEHPCGEKQVTNPLNGEKGTMGLYGYWQTDEWDGGEVTEGRLPRNEFNNIYLYQPSMCPRGGIYIESSGIQRVAEELGKDFVPAVIAWYYKGGSTMPLIRGAVYIKEDVPQLVAAWKVSYRRWKEEEKKASSARCLSNWKKLMKGVMRLNAVRNEFQPIHNTNKKYPEE